MLLPVHAYAVGLPRLKFAGLTNHAVETADRVCGKWLMALGPRLTDSMERHGHLDFDLIVNDKVLAASAASIDRMLASTRLQIDGQRRRRKGTGAAVRRSIAVRTFADWRDPPPGFFEMDMVEHYNGPKTDDDLPTQMRGKHFYLYLFEGSFGRKAMEWQVLDCESAGLASQLLQDICARHGIGPDQLTVYFDNRGPMRGQTMLTTPQQLGVAHSCSRFAVSDDNPHPGSVFKPPKYRPQPPVKPFF